MRNIVIMSNKPVNLFIFLCYNTYYWATKINVMRNLVFLSIALGLYACTTQNPTKTNLNLLTYDQPATDWNEALPLGNGRLGAMVFGDPTNEVVQLNENTIWADDAYMAISFLCRMGEFANDKKMMTDAAKQVLNYTKYLWSPEKQLYHHCYHTDTKEHGVAHWSRANGWVFMAQAELLNVMPENHPLRKKVLENFRMQARGIARYQGKNGLWHQVLDREDSYEEITGTAMFVFGIARGVKKGWLHPDMIYVADQGLKGMMKQITPNGDVTNICVGTGIMPSLQYYYNRPTQENDPMGEGPVLRALIEMIDAPKYTEVSAEQQYDNIGAKR